MTKANIDSLSSLQARLEVTLKECELLQEENIQLKQKLGLLDEPNTQMLMYQS